MSCILSKDLDDRGYPKDRLDIKLYEKRHGIVLQLAEGQRFYHSCRRRACINPEHMQIVRATDRRRVGQDPAAKYLRMEDRARSNAAGCLIPARSYNALDIAEYRKWIAPEYPDAICGSLRCINPAHLWNKEAPMSELLDRARPRWLRPSIWDEYPKLSGSFDIEHLKNWCRANDHPVTRQYLADQGGEGLNSQINNLIVLFHPPKRGTWPRGSGRPHDLFSINDLDRILEAITLFEEG